MDPLFYFLLGVVILPVTIYFTVKAAVKEGTYNALIEYDKQKTRGRFCCLDKC